MVKMYDRKMKQIVNMVYYYLLSISYAFSKFKYDLNKCMFNNARVYFMV